MSLFLILAAERASCKLAGVWCIQVMFLEIITIKISGLAVEVLILARREARGMYARNRPEAQYANFLAYYSILQFLALLPNILPPAPLTSQVISNINRNEQ